MYKCKECGAEFEEFKTVTETHGLEYGPFEELSVCPNCGGSGVVEMVRNVIPRTVVIDMLLDAMWELNRFENKIVGFLNDDIANHFFDGKERLWDMYCILAADSKYPLDWSLSEVFQQAETIEEFELLERVAKRVIEGAL